VTVPDAAFWRRFLGAEVGVDVDRLFRKMRTRDNDFLQDRAAIREGNFTGIHGMPNQDIAMWETMRPIADLQATGHVIGRGEPYIPNAKPRSFEGVVSMTQYWRTLGVAPEELELAPISEAAE
jgi:phthalate 4,5-dioxygenase oxygenase subunit